MAKKTNGKISCKCQKINFNNSSVCQLRNTVLLMICLRILPKCNLSSRSVGCRKCPNFSSFVTPWAPRLRQRRANRISPRNSPYSCQRIWLRGNDNWQGHRKADTECIVRSVGEKHSWTGKDSYTVRCSYQYTMDEFPMRRGYRQRLNPKNNYRTEDESNALKIM